MSPPPLAAAPPAAPVGLPSTAVQIPLSAEPVPAVTAREIGEPAVGGPRQEWQAGQAVASKTGGIFAGVGRIGGSVVRWSLRLALIAVVVGGAGAGARKARDYWMNRPAGSDRPATDTAPATLPGGPAGAPLRVGRLQVESEPTGAKVLVDGRNRGVTPLTVDSLPVGAHTVSIDSSKGTVRRSVTIVANETARISESIFDGWLAVASPFELVISDRGQTLHGDERDQFVLAPGTHEILLENRSLGYRDTRRVDIRPGEVTRISVTPTASSISVTATVPASVTVDGEPIGDTPLSGHPINLGTRDVVVTAASGGERRFTITVTAAPVKLDVDFSK